MAASLSRGALVGVSSLMLLIGAGCTAQAPAVGSRGCGVASPVVLDAAGAGALPPGILDVSAVAGTRQAWAVGDRVPSLFHLTPHHGYLLRFSGADWSKVATFRRWVDLEGVSAVSGRSAWVWGSGYLALVSAGVVRRLQPPWLKGLYITGMASDGAADTWLAGDTSAGPLLEHWDGRSWERSVLPAGTVAGFTRPLSLSTDGRASAWLAVVPKAGPPLQWVLHWNGQTWSRSYAPSARLYGGRYDESGPAPLSVGGSGGRAWVAYTEERVPKGATAEGGSPSTSPTSMLSAYFDGSSWTAVRVPGPLMVLSEVAASGPDAWATGYSSPAILCSRLGGPWQSLPVPWQGHWPCGASQGSLDIAPPYAIVTGKSDLGRCAKAFGYVYDGRHWRLVRPG